MYKAKKRNETHEPAVNHAKKTAFCFLKIPTVPKDGLPKGPRFCPPLLIDDKIMVYARSFDLEGDGSP